MGDQYSEAAVKLGQYIAPSLDREVTDEDYPLFDLLLDFAKDKIFAQGYPFGNRPDELPSQYQSLQVRIAAELYKPHRRKRTDELHQQWHYSCVGKLRCSTVPAE